MTYSNGTFSPHPFANPFNSRLGPSNVSFNPLVNRHAQSTVNKTHDPKSLQVPNQDIPMYGTQEWEDRYGSSQQNNLHVPNQDIPLGDQSGKQGFLRNTSMFRCQDGTIVDFKTGKIMYSPNDSNSEYWGDQNACIQKGIGQSWNDDSGISFEQLVNDPDKYHGAIQTENDSILPIDPRSAGYWLQAEEEAARLIDQMSDEQKKMIQDFESHFPKSRLIEESLKKNAKKI